MTQWASGDSLSPSNLNSKGASATSSVGFSTNTLAAESGGTIAVSSSASMRDLLVGHVVNAGGTPLSTGSAVQRLVANSSVSNYLYFEDSSAAKSNYVLGSNFGGTTDGLNIGDASANTLIVSFSKQSVRFFQPVVGTVFDTGGALAGTYNAALFAIGSAKSVQIQAAINAAAADHIARVYVPANMYPYDAAHVSFNTTVLMIREGGATTNYDVKAYGAAGDGVTDDTAAVRAALNQAAAGGVANGQGHVVFVPQGTYEILSQLTVGPGVFFEGETQSGSRLQAAAVFPNSGGTDQTNQYLLVLGAGGGGVHNNFIRVNDLFLECNGNANGIFGDDLNLGCVVRDVYINNYGGSTGTAFGVRIDGNAYPGSFGANTCEFRNVTVSRRVSIATGGYGISFENASFGPILVNCGAQSNTTLSAHSGGFRTVNCPISAYACWTDISGVDGFNIGSGSAALIKHFSASAQSVGVHITTTAQNVLVQGVYALSGTTTLILDDGAGYTPASNITASGAGASVPAYFRSGVNVDRLGNVPTMDGIVITGGSASVPGVAFGSEISLGLYRSANSTIAQSYGTFTAPTLNATTSNASTFNATHILVQDTGNETSLSLDSAIVLAGPTSGSAASAKKEIIFKSWGGSANAHATLALETQSTAAFESADLVVGVRTGTGNTAPVEVARFANAGQFLLPAGSATLPTSAFTSEVSLGWYRSGTSTMALSYGTFNLGGAILSSLRTTNASGTSATVNDKELRIVAVSTTSAQLAFRSGNTTYLINASATAL